MKYSSLIFLLLILLASCSKPKPAAESPAEVKSDTLATLPVVQRKPLAPDSTGMRDGYLIHLSSGISEPFKVCLALQMAADLSAHNDVMLYFDLKGAEVVLKEAKEIEFAPFPPSRKTLEALMSYQVKLRVNEASLQALWKKKEDLIKGVELLKPGEFSEISSGRIITLTY